MTREHKKLKIQFSITITFLHSLSLDLFPSFFHSELKGFKNSTLPIGGINVFATMLHTHLAGRYRISMGY